MSAQRDDIQRFLQGGAKAFSFENVGDSVRGEITEMDLRQQTDLETGEPLTWKNGQPRMVLVITLQTELQDDDNDDGVRTVWARGGNFTVASGSGTSSLVAIKDALRRAGVTDIEIGGTMTVSHTGLGKSSARGMNPPKLYTAEYTAPSRNVSLEDLGG